MATEYRKTKFPCRPWRPKDHQRFEDLFKTLKWESYPNGNSGWEDNAASKFEDAGFIVKKILHGNPAVISIVTIDIPKGAN
jgi:hypothetical protein